MSAAIALAHPDRLFIGGNWVAPATTSRLRLVNPTSEEYL
jgi:aldehyde dehydrogenase (NAD+)